MAKQPPGGFLDKLFSRFGLGKILVLLLVMMIAGTVGTVGFLSFLHGQEGVNDLATQLQDSLQDRIEHELDEFLSKPHALNRINAETLRSGLVSPRDFLGQRAQFLQQVQAFPSVVTCAFGSAGGDFIGAGWRSDGVFDSALADKAVDNDYRVFILDEQGQPAELVDTVRDYDPRSRSWYQAALKAGEPTWSPVYIWASQQNIGISAVVPVYDGSGALMGVQLSALSLENISRFLGSLKIGKSGQAFIVERSGMLVASSFEPSIRPSAGSQKATAERFQAVESASPLIRSAAGYLTERHGHLDRIVGDERMRVSVSGEDYFLNAALYSDKRGLEWLVAVIVPESDFMAHADANARITLLMSIAALIAAVLLGVFIARWLTQPILKLNAAAQEMSQGKWQEITVPERFHEVAQLAASFNRMGVQLRGVFETLENRVRERTHELASANEQLHIEIVERKQVEEALRAREADLREAQRVAHIGSWHWDAHTDITTGTDELLRIYGFDPATQKIPNFKDQLGVWYLVEEWKRLNAAVQEAMRTGVGYHMDIQALRSGVPIWITTRCEIVRDPDSRIAGLRGTVQDITERKRAEEALRASEERFRAVFESSNDCILVWDRQYNYLYANQAAIDHVGTTRDKVIGRNIRDGLGHIPDFMRLWMERVDRALATGEPFRVEDAVPVGDRLVYSESQISPIRDAAGRVFAVGVVYRDTTARKQVEEALRQSEQRLARAQEIAHLGSWELDLVANHLTWSDEVYRMFGLTPREFGATYEAFLERVHPDDRAAVDAAYFSSLHENRDSYEIEHRVVRKDTGEVRHVHEKCEHFRDADGQIVCSVGMVHDITERKAAEEALRQLNESLEQRVAERTVVAEERSRQLQALAMELIEAEERERQRVAELLHDDLQQILAAARMQLQAVCESLPPEPMLANVEQLLEESIGKSRRLSHELSPAVLHHSGLMAALKWLTGQMKNQFGLNVQLESNSAQQFESAPFKVFLFRAVQELLFNVVKHAGVNSARVEVSGSDSSLFITVSDQGLGLKPDILGSSTSTGGFGLLSLHERARYIGGSLVIESTPGQGSRFTLTVPISLDRASEVERLEADRKPLTRDQLMVTAGAGSIRVLFVDDHQVMRQGLIRLMNGQPDIQVVGEAANGREAIERVRQLKPDVVVMDVSMPEMDGIEATRRIKAELPHVRVIGLSMHDDEQVARSMREAGAEAFMSKTVSTAELLKTIYYWITRQEQGDTIR